MQKPYIAVILIAILVGLLTTYRFIPPENKFAYQADEGHYLAYANFLAERGIGAYPEFYRVFLSDKKNWIWPSPLRFGYFALVHVWFRVFGPSFRSLAHISFVSFVALLLVSFYFARKHFSEETAWLFVLLLAFSPLTMAAAKRALSDSPGNLISVLMLWLFLGYLSNKKISSLIVFMAASAYAILLREQSVLILAACAVFFLVYKYRYKAQVSNTNLALMIVAPIAVVGLTMLATSQSVYNLRAMVEVTRTVPELNEYSVLYCRGPWFRYIVDLMLISPLTTLIGLSYIGSLTLRRRVLGDYKVAFFVCVCCALYLFLSIVDYNKNVRYAITIEMMVRLFAVFMIQDICRGSKRPILYAFLAVLALSIVDYAAFVDIFGKKQVYDPISDTLLKVRLFIPS